MIDLDQLRSTFEKRFGRAPRIFRAPGRINLIGEHTDYNEGFCMPFAIDRETRVAVAPREDRVVRVVAANFDDEGAFDLDRDVDDRGPAWLRYVEGVARTLDARGQKLRGADVVVAGNIPGGAGLSSSAALEIGAGLALLAVSPGVDVSRMDLAVAGQTAEHQYVGTQCGLMDQLAVSFSRAGHATLVDCRTFDLETIPLDLGSQTLVACDSRVAHSLASSAYNERRRECTEAVAALAGALPGITALRDVTREDLEAHGNLLSETLLRRARHVVSENARTLAAADALRHGEVDRLGELMTSSHRSLQHDYEVSCEELDLLVEIALETDGVAGSRMTGGGFGGSTITLVEASAVEALVARYRELYTARTGIEPHPFVVRSTDGASEIV